MTTTPLPRKPTGKLAFAYQTFASLEQAIADLKAENRRFLEALDEIAISTHDDTAERAVRAALESKHD